MLMLQYLFMDQNLKKEQPEWTVLLNQMISSLTISQLSSRILTMYLDQTWPKLDGLKLQLKTVELDTFGTLNLSMKQDLDLMTI